MKRVVCLCIAVVILAALASCGNSGDSYDPSEELIGTWRSSGGGAYLSFMEGGTAKYDNIGNGSIRGIWRISDGKLELTLSQNLKVYEYSVTADRLILEIDGQADTWYRN